MSVSWSVSCAKSKMDFMCFLWHVKLVLKTLTGIIKGKLGNYGVRGMKISQKKSRDKILQLLKYSWNFLMWFTADCMYGTNLCEVMLKQWSV